MTKRLTTAHFILLVLALLVAAPASLADKINSLNITPQPPSIDAKSWILVDYKSGQVLAEHQADEMLPPASLTKLMTAYIVERQMERDNISDSDLVPISVKAWRTGGSRMFVREGTQVPISDLMQGLVVQSGNDAAVALAEYVAGSTGAFATIMNAIADQLDMTNSHFINPTGLPDPNHYTTARDLATLAAHIIKDYPEHYKLYKQKSFTYNNITQHNRVLLLWRDHRVDGLKTGHTKAAGYCQVTSGVDKNDMRMIAVVMGTKSTEARAVESEKLLNYGFRFFENYTAYETDKTLVSPRIWLGKDNHVDLGIAKELTVTIPHGASSRLSVDTKINSQLEAPVSAGDVLGTVSISLDGSVVKTEPLVALHAVPQAGFLSRIWDHILMFVSSLFS